MYLAVCHRILKASLGHMQSTVCGRNLPLQGFSLLLSLKAGLHGPSTYM